MGAPHIKVSPKDYWEICFHPKYVDQCMHNRPIGCDSFIPTINGTEILMEQGVETIGLEAVLKTLYPEG